MSFCNGWHRDRRSGEHLGDSVVIADACPGGALQQRACLGMRQPVARVLGEHSHQSLLQRPLGEGWPEIVHQDRRDRPEGRGRLERRLAFQSGVERGAE